jgi:hypothetical protein
MSRRTNFNKRKNLSVPPNFPAGSVCAPEDLDAICRRQFLELGVSLAAFASVGSLLGSKSAHAAPAFALQRKLIWINMSGGWDILEVTDPKASSTSGIDMLYGQDEAHQISGTTDDTYIGRWLPNIAAIGQDLLVVRGLAMGTTSHTAGSIYMDTGILSNAGRVNAASIPAIVASESNATIPIIQLNGGADPQTDRGLLNPVSTVRAENLALYRSMYPSSADGMQRRLRMLDYVKSSLGRFEQSVGTNDRLSGLKAAEEKVRGQFASNIAEQLALTASDRTTFQEGAPQGMSTSMSDAVALTLKLIKNDVCSCINLGFGGFDTHQGQTQRLQPILASVDFLIGKLVSGLKAAGKLDETLIVLYSDFGRTPMINNSNGRDHWPTGGALVIGGGIAGGRAVGATDDMLRAANLIHPETGKETSDAGVGLQLNPTHLGGMILELALGSGYSQYRPYLTSIPALTRLKG